MNYEFENGQTLWFTGLGHALEYAHINKTRIVRELG
jgi:hypothetical protein